MFADVSFRKGFYDSLLMCILSHASAPKLYREASMLAKLEKKDY